MLLEFSRPGGGELDEIATAELEHHLAGCPECEEHSRGEQRLDQHLGQAMRQVEVPDRLRSVLLARLAQEPANRSGKRLRWIVGLATSAAAVLLVGLGLLLWHSSQLPTVDLSYLPVHLFNDSSPSPKNIQESFRTLGYEVTIPEDLNFNLLVTWGLSDFQGKQVPELVFRSPDGTKNARVYLVTSKQFTLRKKDLQPPLNDDEYRYRVDPPYKEGDRQACIIFYTGDDLSWLHESHKSV